MDEGDSRKTDVRFILIPDPQALARLLPLVVSLALSAPIEEGGGLEGLEASENSPAQG